MSTWYLPPCPDNNTNGYVLYTYDTISSEGTITTIVQPIGTTGAIATSIDFSNNHISHKTTTVIPPLLSIDSRYSRSPLCFLYNRDVLQQCTDHLCNDVQQYFALYVDHYHDVTKSSENADVNIPLILQHGDASLFRAEVAVDPWRQHNNASTTAAAEIAEYMGNPNIPICKKFRRAMTQTERTLAAPTSNYDNKDKEQCRRVRHRRIEAVSMQSKPTGRIATTMTSLLYHYAFQPIISIVSNFGRHFYSLMHVTENDSRSWDQKHSKAVYRGLCTGRSKSVYRGKKLRDTDHIYRITTCANKHHAVV